jgi:hypothetical protein
MFHHVLVLNYYAAFGGFRTDIRMVDARVHTHARTYEHTGSLRRQPRFLDTVYNLFSSGDFFAY